MSSPPCIAYCTCPDSDCAERIAGVLVNEGLAACVSLLPNAKSVYRWDGKLCQDTEVLMMIKTTQARLKALEARLLEEHPYDVPELIVVPVIAGSEEYLQWMDSCTANS
ncbi:MULTISPECIES: divalent-cation tolerance protein CutA [Thiorhodovibrio]|uniref:divalent-cation tolerance protein CutA n=1 Tax=Thiorhodovibrio TaxID=61593 RepID=UPI001911E5EE|nr:MULTISPECIES: divalent-cation tolerance protein CutA [Thiorhodovibrio]MBK5970434.1 divalent-cation tolerance protein CutA [Thiorhodovibrio winogradskyi]WPL11442.1 Divalent-cation tolerance protein CutA [Thiorhodovibrio litoralis]